MASRPARYRPSRSELDTFEALDLSEREAQEVRAMKTKNSRQGDPVMTQGHAAQPVQVRARAGQDPIDVLVVDVWKKVAVLVVGWLILLGLALLALSSVAERPPRPLPPRRTEAVAPGSRATQSQPTGPQGNPR
jgi:hypothetical protein